MRPGSAAAAAAVELCGNASNHKTRRYWTVSPSRRPATLGPHPSSAPHHAGHPQGKDVSEGLGDIGQRREGQPELQVVLWAVAPHRGHDGDKRAGAQWVAGARRARDLDPALRKGCRAGSHEGKASREGKAIHGMFLTATAALPFVCTCSNLLHGSCNLDSAAHMYAPALRAHAH